MCSLIKVVSSLILVYLSLSQKIAKIKQNYLQAGKTQRSWTRRKETEKMPLVFQESLYLGKLHFCFPHRYTLQAHATSPHSGLGGQNISKLPVYVPVSPMRWTVTPGQHCLHLSTLQHLAHAQSSTFSVFINQKTFWSFTCSSGLFTLSHPRTNFHIESKRAR